MGTLFTSLDMKGVSVSLLPVGQQRLARLDAPTQVHPSLALLLCMPCHFCCSASEAVYWRQALA